MRRGLALLLFGYLVATACADSSSSSSSEESDESSEEGGRGRYHRGGGHISERVDDNAQQLEGLEKRLEAIRDSLSHDDHVDHSLNVVAKLEELEGDYCADGEFNCGGHSQCVSDLLACDGTQDCPNGNDEDEHRCTNRAQAGDSFRGRIHWDGCKANGDADMTIKITTSKSYNYFHPRVWLTASTTFDYGDRDHSFDGSGYFDFGMNGFDIAAPAGEHVQSHCRFVSDDVADCEVTSSIGAHCASVRLVRM